jgi:hypothetical protein
MQAGSDSVTEFWMPREESTYRKCNVSFEKSTVISYQERKFQRAE